ncbi:acyl-ACP--UDP-N-acetylglucosamine O-acyltransferase [Romeria aff. gracilis LEGE 07310]|uniref:Acyl-[acyl-carrier-protein]--UDP-N-acetylglucosamine O-acyltransferase n=1 Tax=Vasconcelosia minhoensis LEGE 07310 TaxID=915328 RepID=A0A8J7A5D8_9CYAN|nr:acyl-ACP--UDP-N-acetylglucosamine O-acyltransferase [Romeria gracilis]MBE9076300.1 acyl-ACP--UDP-N-acetylglucosamine O-acyltransferase [Romeria aff. gracilis LEGE 07310]
MTTLIHPTAVVQAGAELHPSVQVGPYAVIGEKVAIGPNTQIGAHAVLDGHTTIGARNRIFPHAAIGLEPQDLKYDGSLSRVQIGDDNCIRECVTVNRPTRLGEVTYIGDRNLIMAYSHIAHNCRIASNVIIANSAALAGHVQIEAYARISGIVAVHQFVHIGRYAMIGGMSRVVRDVPPYTMVEGNPSRIRGLNQVLINRSGIAQEDGGDVYRGLKQAYRLLYRSGLRLDEALSKLERLTDNERVRHLYEFLISSQAEGRRGPITGRRK